ncbi:2056_t:CDS:2, partial [Entrophospora sp. SA101]
SKSKQMGSFIGVVTIKQLISGKLCSCYSKEAQAPRLGCSGGCKHLNLIPLNNE